MFDKPSLHCLIANGVISKIAQLLIDKDCNVKEAAAGTLRYAKETINSVDDIYGLEI